MGGVAKNPIGTIGRGLAAGVTGGLSEFAQKDPFGAPIHNPLNRAIPINNDYLKTGSLFNSESNPYVSGPFSLDPNQVAGDQNAITGLGNKQYSDTLGAIDTNSAAQTQRAKDLFGQMLPDIAENAQAAHLYDSTGYGQEVGRQQANIASQVAADAAQQKLAALQGRQGFETGGLQRGLSMEDQINNANISKSIGQTFAPQPATGKQNFGTVAQGVGALSPWAKLAMAPKTGGK